MELFNFNRSKCHFDVKSAVCRLSNDERGFTLIDMSIILILIGLFVVPTLKMVDYHYQQKRFGQTQSNVSTSNIAIEQFFFLNGFYPCPADPTLNETDAAYGTADCTLAGANVIAGAVPFVDLRIPVSASLDGYKNKINYVVSRNVTALATFAAGGAITFQAVDLADFVTINTTSTTGHYALLSHGQNGNGAFASSGAVVAACPNPVAARDDENCNGDATFLFPNTIQARVNNPQYMDDWAVFQTTSPTRIWMISNANPDDIFSNSGLIGIGTNTPQVGLDVAGNVRTTGGNTHSNNYFDDDLGSATWFETDMIAGGGISCPPNQVMTGIQFGGPICGVAAAGYSGDCSATYTIGYTSAGALICAP